MKLVWVHSNTNGFYCFLSLVFLLYHYFLIRGSSLVIWAPHGEPSYLQLGFLLGFHRWSGDFLFTGSLLLPLTGPDYCPRIFLSWWIRMFICQWDKTPQVEQDKFDGGTTLGATAKTKRGGGPTKMLSAPLSTPAEKNQCYYPLQSRDSVSPVCRIFFTHIWFVFHPTNPFRKIQLFYSIAN